MFYLKKAGVVLLPDLPKRPPLSDYLSRAGPVSRAASVWAGPVVM